MLPPGDLRNCMIALSAEEDLLSKLFAYRFKSGIGLLGHSFGNLFITALTDITGDFNRVILEHEAENMGEFDPAMKDYATNVAFRDKMKGYTDLYATGTREILQVV